MAKDAGPKKATRRPAAAEPEEHENLERWLLTYADMITLLVAFFIMMYSMSVLNIKKFEAAAISIRSGFGGHTTGGKGRYFTPEKSWLLVGDNIAELTYAPIMQEHQGEAKKRSTSITKRGTDLLRYVNTQLAFLKMDSIIQPVLDIKSEIGTRLCVVLSDKVFFEPGETSLSPEAIKIATHIGNSLTNSQMSILVEGYASHQPVETGNIDSWQISLERARQTAKCLVDNSEINPRRLVLMGYGKFKTAASTKKLAMTEDGEWKMLDDAQADKTLSNDRVVISVLIK